MRHHTRRILRRPSALIISLLIAAAASCYGQDGTEPVADGYVTRVTSASDFDVNGVRVIVTSATKYYLQSGNKTRSSASANDVHLHVGEPAQVFGKLQKNRTFTASELRFRPNEPREVSGAAVIDAILPASSGNADDHLVRADGYRVLISTNTRTIFTPPLTATSAYGTNVWIKFHGTQRLDGVVVADMATLQANTINGGEEKFLSKREYNPASVDPNAKQNSLSKAFLGLDPKRIPPYQDATMQARVEEIGAKLVPRYQRELPDNDPAKIDFRFQVVDQKKWNDAMALPSGIILIPHQVVERMENDSQLATVLADNIACVLEKQTLRLRPTVHKMTAAGLLGGVGGAFVPGLGIATSAAGSAVNDKLMHQNQDQSGRVSLSLLHDAGFDIHEAPMAWWRLASPLNPLDTPLPRRAANLYKTLGQNWQGGE